MNDYDPIGGHTKEEADAAYEALLRELHGEEESGGGFNHPPAVCVLAGQGPSTDGVCAAICCARLKNAIAARDGLGREAAENRAAASTMATGKAPAPYAPYISGVPDETTLAALARFGAELPETLTDISGKDVILVGFNDPARAPSGLAYARILEIIDCHALAGLTTKAPVHCNIQPVGAASTLICQLFSEYGISPEPGTAGLLCAGIVSATRLFTTPETAKADRLAAATLANACALDLSSLLPIPLFV
ncbi:MAG: DHH family phosphoesterase [Clostridiales Family XIII bacterium]|jgi:inorganic pyrophosphatase/exopolyphosphatase|nr:DHH family phosphoesterase [Clostridiales Family XIII bacterium]